MNHKKFAAILLATTMGASALPVQAVYGQSVQKETQSETSVKVSNFTIASMEEYPAYKEAFQVTGIKSYTTNGGQYSSSSLDKAFDGNKSTHWETGKPNSTSHVNEIIVTFENVEDINRIVYLPRQDAGNKGFATAFSIYASMSESGNDFELVGSGTAAKTGAYSEFKFEKTSFKRLKFVFDKADNNWASASELSFFREDAILSEVEHIFTNGLMMELSEKYQDKEALADYLAQLKEHPLAGGYNGLIKTITDFVNGKTVDAETVITLPQKGHEVAERNRTKIAYALYSHEPTGVTLSKGETLKVYVDADEKGTLPELVVGLSHFIKLAPGYNEITLPEQFAGPSQIYITNRAYSTE